MTDVQPETPRSRTWWVPLAIALGLLVGSVILVSQLRVCGPVLTSVPEAQREAALQRGDTVPAAEQDGDLTRYTHVCTWR